MHKIRVEQRERTTIVSITRPEVRNAVDGETARCLAAAFEEFDANPESDVAVLYGDYGTFCAGADLKAIAAVSGSNQLSPEGDGPMGPSRMVLGKPVIAAIAGHAVAGGLEAGPVVRPACGGAQRHHGRVLPALGCATDRRRHDTTAPPDRA